jgi:hypothetical protein
MDLGLELNGCPWKKKHRRARKYGPTYFFLSVVVWSRRTHYCMRYLTLYHKLRKTHLARNKRYCHKQQNFIPLFHPNSREFPSLDTDSPDFKIAKLNSVVVAEDVLVTKFSYEQGTHTSDESPSLIFTGGSSHCYCCYYYYYYYY